MPIDYQRLKQWPFADQVTSYSEADCMRYALSLGFASDPLDEEDLRFVHEEGTLVVPTFLATIGAPGAWAADPGTGIDWMKILHGEHRMRFYGTPKAAGAVRSRTRVSRLVDKGAGKGALVVTEREITDQASGQPLASVEHVSFCRADGGFGAGDDPPEALPPVPQGEPDAVLSVPTLPQAALLYRLNGDRNPIHALPAAARDAGFERPILHGLCTYGMAARALLKTFCPGWPAGLASLAARFSAPFQPGETLRVEMWRSGSRVHFRALAEERNAVVLSHGLAEIRPQA